MAVAVITGIHDLKHSASPLPEKPVLLLGPRGSGPRVACLALLLALLLLDPAALPQPLHCLRHPQRPSLGVAEQSPHQLCSSDIAFERVASALGVECKSTSVDELYFLLVEQKLFFCNLGEVQPASRVLLENLLYHVVGLPPQQFWDSSPLRSCPGRQLSDVRLVVLEVGGKVGQTLAAQGVGAVVPAVEAADGVVADGVALHDLGGEGLDVLVVEGGGQSADELRSAGQHEQVLAGAQTALEPEVVDRGGLALTTSHLKMEESALAINQMRKTSSGKLGTPSRSKPARREDPVLLERYVKPGLSLGQVTRLKQCFDSFDHLSTGLVSSEELANIIVSLGMQGQAGTIFAHCKANSKKQGAEDLDFDSFMELFGFNGDLRAEPTQELLWKHFNEKGKGFVTTEDFVRMAQLSGETYSQAELRQMVLNASKTGVDKLTYEQFCTVLNKEYLA